MSLIKMGDSDYIAELAEEGEFVCNDFLIAVSSEGDLELKTGVNDLCNVKVPSITLKETWSHYCVTLVPVGSTTTMNAVFYQDGVKKVRAGVRTREREFNEGPSAIVGDTWD